MATANLGVRIVLEDGAKSGLDALGLSFGGLYGAVGMLAHAWGTLSPTTQALGVTAGITGLAFGGLAELLKSSVDAAGELEQELNKVKITVNGAADAGDALTTTLVHIADTSIFTTAQVADAFSQLGIDGWNATQIMDGLGQTTIDFAEAAQTRTVPAALLLGSTMKMFGASADEATQYANDLTFAMYNGQKNATNLQQVIAQVGPIAAIAGVNFNELAVEIAYMGEQGFTGSRAGTALRYMISGLTSPTQAAAKEMRNLGLAVLDASGNVTSSKFFDSQGQFIGVAKSIDVLHTALGNLNPMQQMEALKALFSVRGGQGVELFLKNYADWLTKANDLTGIENATSVTGKAAQVTDTFNAAVIRVKTTWNDFKAMLGSADLGPLKSAFNGIATELDKFNTASPAVHTFAGVLLTLGTAGAGVLFAASSLGFMVRATKELGVLGDLGKIGSGFGNLLSPIGHLSSASSSFFKHFASGLPGMVGKGAKAAYDLHVGFFDAIARGIDKFSSMDISGVPSAIVGAFKGIGPALSSLPSLLMSGFSAIPGMFSGLGSAAAGAIPAIIGVGGAILPIIGIVLAVVGAIAIVVLMFTKFRTQTMQLWQDITGGRNILDLFKNVFVGAFNQIKQTWNQVWPQIRPAMNQLFQALHQAVPLFQAIGIVIGAVIAVILAVIVGLVNGFIHALPGIITFFTGVFQIIGGITRLIMAIFTGQWGEIPKILGGIWTGVKNVLGGALQAVWGLISGFVGGIIGFFQHLFDVLLGHSIIPDIANGAVKVFTAMKNLVVGILTALVDGALAVFHMFQAGVQLVITAIVFILKLLVTGALVVVHAISSEIIMPLLSIFNRLETGAMAVIHGVIAGFNMFRSSIAGAVDFIIGTIHRLISAISNIPGVGGIASGIRGIGSALHIPGLANGGVVTAPTLAVVGEGKEPEVVMPLSKLQNFMSTYSRNGGSGAQHIHINVDGREVAGVVMDTLTGQLRQNGLGRAFR